MFGHDDNDNHHQSDDDAKTVVANGDWQHPDLEQNGPAAENHGEATQQENHHTEQPADPTTTSQSDASGAPHNNDLIDLKQQALSKLSPLVDKLNQSPDDKFRTLMMMIQASDNQRLVHQAYETALQIHDEKERAQALLDIINEINYFTQNGGSSDE